MIRIKIFNILLCIIVILSYLSVTFPKYISFVNAIMAIFLIGIGGAWILKNLKEVKMSRFILIYLSFFLIVVTQKFNLISLGLIGVLCIIADSMEGTINIRLFLRITIVCFCIVVGAYFILGFNKSCDSSIWRVSSNTTLMRSSLGFEHANQAMFKWLSIALAFLSLSNRSNLIKMSGSILIITLIIYKFTLSRTSVIVILIVIILMFLFKNKLNEKISRRWATFLGKIPILFTGISILSLYLNKFEYINSLFSGRFRLYNQYFEIAGWNLWGNSFIENQAMLDNSYLHMLLAKGLIFSITYIIFIYLLIKRARYITVCDAIIIFGYYISGLTETILFKFDLIILIIIIIYRGNLNGRNSNE